MTKHFLVHVPDERVEGFHAFIEHMSVIWWPEDLREDESPLGRDLVSVEEAKPSEGQSEVLQVAFDALRAAEDRLVNTLPQVSHHDMDLWKEARELVKSSPDWSTYRIDREDEKGVFRALIYQFKAIESVRNALRALFDTGQVRDEVSGALASLGFVNR